MWIHRAANKPTPNQRSPRNRGSTSSYWESNPNTHREKRSTERFYQPNARSNVSNTRGRNGHHNSHESHNNHNKPAQTNQQHRPTWNAQCDEILRHVPIPQPQPLVKQSTVCAATTIERIEQPKSHLNNTPTKTVDTVKEADSIAIEDDREEEPKCSSGEPTELDFRLLKFDQEEIELGHLPEIKINDQFKCNQTMRIYLAQIHSPYKFWFNLSEHAEHVESLMSRMEYVQIAVWSIEFDK